ncbi:Crp/Fnr family transcriptional regulator [Tropicimonas marinistellae]|uniref:Crp/Fnr family transcriptional regulator n=1 Tax=Tropicimonas marinistellae TaxID=1739787 RepID=UPI0008364AEA|nr:Crp/Fnr family transcriptional regulator [Tropicimonas marinistellae]
MQRSKTEALKDHALSCIACKSRLCAFARAAQDSVSPRIFEIARGDRLECLSGNCLKFWIIIRGTAAICTVLEDGRRQIVSLPGASDVVCGLLADGGNPHWLEALDTCEVCEIDFTPCAAELAHDPTFMHAMMDLLHAQLVRTSQHLITLGRLDSTERLIFFLAQLSFHPSQADGATAPVQLPMSREDIADYLGLNAETVSRILTKLRKSGLVKFLNRSEFYVPDMAALRRRLPLPLLGEDAAVIGQFTGKDAESERAQA